MTITSHGYRTFHHDAVIPRHFLGTCAGNGAAHPPRRCVYTRSKRRCASRASEARIAGSAPEASAELWRASSSRTRTTRSARSARERRWRQRSEHVSRRPVRGRFLQMGQSNGRSFRNVTVNGLRKVHSIPRVVGEEGDKRSRSTRPTRRAQRLSVAAHRREPNQRGECLAAARRTRASSEVRAGGGKSCSHVKRAPEGLFLLDGRATYLCSTY